MPNDTPPRQSHRGQLVDAIFIMLLIFVTLFVTTFVTQLEETSAETNLPASKKTQLSDLPINDTEREQYQKMIDSGLVNPGKVNQLVAENQPRHDKYDISLAALAGTLVLLGGYFTFVYRTSFREYREVVEYRFGKRDEEVKS